jgi:hypothetical protein
MTVLNGFVLVKKRFVKAILLVDFFNRQSKADLKREK